MEHGHGFLGCGLSTLEVAANSYISVLGTPQYAAARLNFSQGFQGVASFCGPLIAARWFFTGANATSLGTVQWCVPYPHFYAIGKLIRTCRVYLAVAGLGVVLNVLFLYVASVFHRSHLMTFFSFATLPEITEEALAEEIQDVGLQDDQGSFWRQYRCIFGFVAQTAYVSVFGQAIGSFCI